MSDEQITPTGDAPIETPETPTGDTPETPETPENGAGTPETPEEDTPINVDEFEIEERDYGTKPQETPDDDDVDAEDKARISKVVDPRLTAVEQRLQKQNDELEVNSYLNDKPELLKYKPVILKYMAHPAYAKIPVKNIANMVSATEMQKIGARKEREAQAKVKETQNGGSSARTPAPTKFNPQTASFAEMEQQIAQVKGQVPNK